MNDNIDLISGVFDRSIKDENNIIDIKPLINNLFLQILTKSSFNFEFCDNNKGIFNHNEYLIQQEVALRERSCQALNPLRRYMFWDKEMIHGESACRNMALYGYKLLKICREIRDKTIQLKESCTASDCTESDYSIGLKGNDKLIIDRLLTNPNYNNDTEIISDLLLFISAGHETTSNTLLFLLLEISRNTSAKEKLLQELDANIINGSKPSLHDMSKLTYLDYCIKESMRLWPVAAGGSTRDLLSDITYNGLTLPRDSTVVIHYYTMFRQPWIDKENEFIPERWMDSNPQLPALKEMFIPFSTGKRQCIGKNMALLQIRVLASNLLRNYNFELMEEPSYEYFVTLKPTNLKMKVTKRSH